MTRKGRYTIEISISILSLDRRGFMTHKGIPDGSRAARLILKDYVSGKLLYCYPPPGYNSEDFQQYSTRFVLDNDSNIETTDEEIASNETTSKVYFILFTKKEIFFLKMIIFSNHVFNHRMSIDNFFNQ
jgi:large subunit GTPase 1